MRSFDTIDSIRHPVGVPGGLVRVGHLFLPGATLVNATDRNSVSSDSPSTVFTNDGSIEDDVDAGTTKECYLHFDSPLTIYGMDVAFFPSTFKVGWDFAAGGLVTSAKVTGTIGFVSSDWDPATLTWNNKPGVSAETTFESQFDVTSGNLGPPTGTVSASLNLGTSHKGVGRARKTLCYGAKVGISASVSGSGLSNILAQATASIFGSSNPSSISVGLSSFGIGE